MSQNKKMVEAITPINEDFTQWYTDICLKAELVDYSTVKGCVILRPYGYAIWENIMHLLDARFKATGHENVAMPLFIPESLLQKEKDHVEGFAPEVAWVTMGGSEPLEDRLCVRPTSETLFCDHFAHVLHSYRDLPMKYNQWCSVVRWEKTTRPFLRTREFWWQEGHTIHETAQEAIEETEQQLETYADFCENELNIPVLKGKKTDKEKFAGAEATYTIDDGRRQGAAERHQPLLWRRVLPRVRRAVYGTRQYAAVSLPDKLGYEHAPHRRHHHDSWRRRGAHPASGHCAVPGGHRTGGRPQARRAGKGRGAARAAL